MEGGVGFCCRGRTGNDGTDKKRPSLVPLVPLVPLPPCPPPTHLARARGPEEQHALDGLGRDALLEEAGVLEGVCDALPEHVLGGGGRGGVQVSLGKALSDTSPHTHAVHTRRPILLSSYPPIHLSCPHLDVLQPPDHLVRHAQLGRRHHVAHESLLVLVSHQGVDLGRGGGRVRGWGEGRGERGEGRGGERVLVRGQGEAEGGGGGACACV